MSAGPEIVRVSSAAERREFLNLPFDLYAGNPNWVPPLRSSTARVFSRKTAFFDHADMELWLARRGGRATARIAAVDNHAHSRRHNDRTGFFGFFECAQDDLESAESLFRRAEEWLAGRGLTSVRGPVNPSMNSECGLLIDGFDRPPMILMPYNPAYYSGMIESCGFRKCKDLYAYLVRQKALLPDTPLHRRLRRIADGLAKRHSNIGIRQLDMRHYRKDIERIMGVFEEARKGNWGYVPITDRELRETASELKMIVDPAVVLVAEAGGRPVGAALALPNINRALSEIDGRLFPTGYFKFMRIMKRIDEMRIFGIAALPEYRHMGITALLALEMVVRGSQRGYATGEASWILEDNDMSNRTVQHAFNPEHYKTYRLYEKTVAVRNSRHGSEDTP